MAGPSGAFVGMSLVELQAELLIARNRIRYGDRVAMAGSAKSSTKAFSMKAADHLREVNFAIARLSGSGVTSTHFDASGQYSGDV
jgi:hypothetical protein